MKKKSLKDWITSWTSLQELNKHWNMKVAVVPVVVGALGNSSEIFCEMPGKRLKIIKWRAKKEFRLTRKQVIKQKTKWSFEKICCHLIFSVTHLLLLVTQIIGK